MNPRDFTHYLFFLLVLFSTCLMYWLLVPVGLVLVANNNQQKEKRFTVPVHEPTGTMILMIDFDKISI